MQHIHDNLVRYTSNSLESLSDAMVFSSLLTPYLPILFLLDRKSLEKRERNLANIITCWRNIMSIVDINKRKCFVSVWRFQRISLLKPFLIPLCSSRGAWSLASWWRWSWCQRDCEIGDSRKLQMPSSLISMSFSKAELEKRPWVHEC